MQAEIYNFVKTHRRQDIHGILLPLTSSHPGPAGKIYKAKTTEEFWRMHNSSVVPIVATVERIDTNGAILKGLVGLGFAEEFFKDLLKEKDLPESLRNEIILCLAFNS